MIMVEEGGGGDSYSSMQSWALATTVPTTSQSGTVLRPTDWRRHIDAVLKTPFGLQGANFFTF